MANNLRDQDIEQYIEEIVDEKGRWDAEKAQEVGKVHGLDAADLGAVKRQHALRRQFESTQPLGSAETEPPQKKAKAQVEKPPVAGGHTGRVKKITPKLYDNRKEKFLNDFHGQNAALYGRLERAVTEGNDAEAVKIAKTLETSLQNSLHTAGRPFKGYDGGDAYHQGIDAAGRASLQRKFRKLGFNHKKHKILESRKPAAAPAKQPKKSSEAEPDSKGWFWQRWNRSRKDFNEQVRREHRSEKGALDWEGVGKAEQKRAQKVGLIYDHRRTEQENKDLLEKRHNAFLKQTREKRLDRISGSDPLTSGLMGRLRRRQGPIGQFLSTLSLLNRNTRIITVVALIVGILFVPMGIFQYAGWSVAALVMVVIGAIYAVLLNLFKVLASSLLAGFNAIWAAAAGWGTMVMEKLLGLFNVAYQDCDLPGADVRSNFCSGHRIAAEGLIPLSELKAMDISLLDADKLRPTPSAEPMIAWFLRLIGLDKWDFSVIFGSSVAARVQDFMETGNLWAVMLVFLVPTVVFGWMLYSGWIKPALKAHGV